MILKWKITVRLHIDQMMRTRSFRVWNEVIDRRAVTKSHKGKKAYVERKVGDCYHWKATGQCSKETHQSWSNRHWNQWRRSGTKRTIVLSRTKFEGKPDGKGTTSKTMGNRDEGSSDKRSKIPCRWRNCTNPSCGCWHPPVCQNCKTEIGCNYEYKSIFDTLSLKRGSVRSRRKGVRKDQLLYCRNLYDCIVYLRILIQGSLFHEKKDPRISDGGGVSWKISCLYGISKLKSQPQE